VSVVLPLHPAPQRRSIYDRTTRGLRIYLATPRLRGLLAINAAVAAAGSMVFVNTVVIVQGGLGLAQSAVALALASFGAGSMLAALALPSLLGKLSDRNVMLGGGGLLVVGMFAAIPMTGQGPLLVLWFLLGLGYATAQTPSGRLLRRSSNSQDRSALFAAQFALSHAAWLLFYPLAGWLGSRHGIAVAFGVLGCAAGLTIGLALMAWPSLDPESIEHGHPNLPAGHPHATGSMSCQGMRHSHPFVIDDLHPRWPREGG